jgi:subtilisin family serine protease
MQYVKLCSCDRNYYKSIQGFEGKTLFERWDAIYNAVDKHIDKQYNQFLAKPEIQGDTIYWYAKLAADDNLIRYVDLNDDDKLHYDGILNETLHHFNSTCNQLRNSNKIEEAECLEKALLFINKEFLFCYNNQLTLGVWGMEINDVSINPFGVAIKVIRKPKAPQIEEFNVQYNPGVHGILNGASSKTYKKGESVSANDVPEINPNDNYEFIGWDAQPINHVVDSDITFNALYREIPEIVEPAPEPPPLPPTPHKVRFNSGDEGELEGESNFDKHKGENIALHEIPNVKPKDGYRFVGWDKVPDNHQVTDDIEFNAKYERIVPPPIPWYKRLWAWFNEAGCLRWLLWLLLILFLLWLLWWLFHTYYHTSSPAPIPDRNRFQDIRNGGDSLNGDTRTGIYNPGDPYTPGETPEPYRVVAPPQSGVIQPVDPGQIITPPDGPSIVANRLNIMMENEDKSILDLAKAFKEKYPDEKYKVVYYDDVVKRMQIEFPPEEREQLKQAIPEQFKPDYNLFVFDESLFEMGYTPNDPIMKDANKSWYLQAIHAPQAWEISKAYAENAKKITVAIVDNGFNLNHPELKSKVVMPYNVWKHSNEVTANAVDHGTHVAGTALAIANNGIGISGIAPDCAFMPIQVADKNDHITTTSVLDGILYALYQGADVVNVSLGLMLPAQLTLEQQKELQQNYFQEEERLWNEVMRIANKHKSIVVFAAGNDNMLAGIEPMNRPKGFIVVSAVDKKNNGLQKAIFSNHGDYSTISAPGVGIYSTVGSNGYETMEGTSMAAPIITGSVALMKSIKRDLTANQVICVLQSTGLFINNTIGNLVQLDKALLKVKNNDLSDCASRPDVPSTGDVQVLLSWNNYNDLDLACEDPRGETVWFRNKFVSTGGQLEIDMNVDYPDNDKPIENIFWKPGTAPKGKYKVYLIYFRKHTGIDETPYKIMVKYGGKTKELSGTIRENDKIKEIWSFTI